MKNNEAATGQELRALSRGLRVLECFSAQQPSLSLTEVAALTALPLPTAWRFLHALVTLGYLRESPSKRYQATVKTLALTGGSLSALSLPDAFPRLGALASQTGVGWVMHVPDGLETVMVAFGFAHPIHVDGAPMGQRFPVSQAPGIAILAAMTAEERQRLLARASTADADAGRVEHLVAEAQEAGYAAVDVAPLSSLCAAIRGFDGRPVAAVGVISFTADLAGDQLARRWGRTVQRVAAQFSEQLGYQALPA